MFVGVTGVLTIRTVQHRTWVMLIFLLGLYLESAALVARAYSTTHLSDTTSFLLAYFGAIIAPSFLAAGCYMVFERLVWFITPPSGLNRETLWIRPRWVTRVFVTLDMLSFGIQFLGICALGASYKDASPADHSQATSGAHLVRLGLIVQLLCFALFGVVALRFIWVSRSWLAQRAGMLPESTGAIRVLIWTLVLSSGLLTLRAIYRVVEFSPSTHGTSASYVLVHEWPYWLFDVAAIAVISVALTIVHPSTALPSPFTRLRFDRCMGAKFTLRLLEEKGSVWEAEHTQPNIREVPAFPVLSPPPRVVLRAD